MLPIEKKEIEKYLSEKLGKTVRIVNYDALRGQGGFDGNLAKPSVLTLDSSQEVVFKVPGTGLGRENLEKRIEDVMKNLRTFPDLPKHVKLLGAGVITNDNKIVDLTNAKEAFTITPKIEGPSYSDLLENNFKTITDNDIKIAKTLAEYLVEIHSVKSPSPALNPFLYRKHIREIFGCHEGLQGIIDDHYRILDERTIEKNYRMSKKELTERIDKIEKGVLEATQKMKDKYERTRKGHGDYHPGNIKVIRLEPFDFLLLDRSRFEWGEPADDVTAMLVNYTTNFALRDKGEYSGNFKRLGDIFIKTYLDGTGDEQVFDYMPPFLAWRSLVIASSIWYPNILADVKRKQINFAVNVSNDEKFDYARVNSYLSD
jgi:hypothetical protein